MKLITINTGSSGNGYILETNNEALVIEAGCTLLELKKAINFNISKIVGTIVSHAAHQDHGKHIPQYMAAGIKVFANMPSGKGSKHHNLMPVIGQFTVGGFKIKPFELVHDVECNGFLISHEEMGTCMFATDTNEIPYSFTGLNHIIIEANYDEDILDNNLINGTIPAYLRNRVMQSHLSLEKCKQFILDTDLKSCMNIVLIHLSGSNSHAVNFAKEIKGISCTNVWIAEKGLVVPVDKNPF